MKKLVAGIFLAALAGLGYFLYLEGQSAHVAPAPVETEGEQTTMQMGTPQRVSEETPEYKIDVEYASVGIAAVDEKITAAVQAAVAAFKEDIGSFERIEGERQYTFTGEMADMYVGADYVSERINIYQDTGGAHGLPIVLTLNYDVRTGEEVSVATALGLVGLTLEDVSQEALLQLNREFGESVFAEGAAPKAENYGTFMVGPYNVTFIFQAYQVVPYAAGMPEVRFNRADQ